MALTGLAVDGDAMAQQQFGQQFDSNSVNNLIAVRLIALAVGDSGAPRATLPSPTPSVPVDLYWIDIRDGRPTLYATIRPG